MFNHADPYQIICCITGLSVKTTTCHAGDTRGCTLGSGETSWNQLNFGLHLIWLHFIYKKWNMKKFYKIFDSELGGFLIENLTLLLKSENLMTSKHRLVGCPSGGKRLELWRCVLLWRYLLFLNCFCLTITVYLIL